MPDVDTHCKISWERTRCRDDFRELHEWMDEPQKHFGINYRIERHTLNDIYLNYVKEKWGEKGVIEWLFHIAIDNLETANMFATKQYIKPFDRIEVKFDGKKLVICKFTKVDDKEYSVDVRDKKEEEHKENTKEILGKIADSLDKIEGNVKGIVEDYSEEEKLS